MERNRIETMTAFIPPSEFGKIAEDDEIWEEDDGGAHLKVTRHPVDVLGAAAEVLALSVSGVFEERDRIIGEFSQVFGPPASTDMAEVQHTVLWVVSA